MTLSEEKKKQIEEEEKLRFQVREELSSKSFGGGCLQVLVKLFVIFPLAMALFPVTIAFAISKRLKESNIKHQKAMELGLVVLGFLATGLFYGALGSLSEKQTQITEPFSVTNLVNKTEEQIKSENLLRIRGYTDTGLTPSGNVKITGFDVGDTNIQIDYSVSTGKPIYFGYSFSASPKQENVAWKFTGFEKPKGINMTNQGIMNSTVIYWENIQEILPFKNVTVIFNMNGKVGKIAFSMEDLATAQSTRSLYHVPNR